MLKTTVWPHKLVFEFAYGRLVTFSLLLGLTFGLSLLIAPPSNSGQLGLMSFFCFIIAYIIPASHFINFQTLNEFDRLAPFLNLSASECEEKRFSLATQTTTEQLRLLVVGVFLGLGHVYILTESEFGFVDSLKSKDTFVLMGMGYTLFIWVLLTMVISMLVRNAFVFSQLAREHVSIDLMDTSYLGAFSRVALSSTLVLVGAQAAFPLLFIQDDINHFTMLPGFLGLFVPMIALFLLPLIPLRNRIRGCKAAEFEAIQIEMKKLTSTVISPATNQDILQTLQPLLTYRDEIKKVKDWSFDSPVLIRLLVYLVIPPLTWIGSALIENIVNSFKI